MNLIIFTMDQIDSDKKEKSVTLSIISKLIFFSFLVLNSQISTAKVLLEENSKI